MLYPCRWGHCHAVFPAHEKLLAHLNEQHFTDEALDQLASFRKGSFNEWLKVTGRDGGTQSTSDNWLPSQVANIDTPKDVPAGTSLVGHGLAPISASLNSKYTFSSLAGASHASPRTPTPPIYTPNASPTVNELVNKENSHIPDLPPSPSSVTSTGTSRSSQDVEFQLTQDIGPDRAGEFGE